MVMKNWCLHSKKFALISRSTEPTDPAMPMNFYVLFAEFVLSILSVGRFGAQFV